MDSSEPPGKHTTGSVAQLSGGDSAGGFRARKSTSPSEPDNVRPARGMRAAAYCICAAAVALAVPGLAAPAPPASLRPFPWEVLIAILAMVLIVAFLAGSETALAGMRKTRLHQLLDEGVAGARPALRLLSQPTRFLATIQVGITLASMFAAALAARVPAEMLNSWLDRTATQRGLPWLSEHSFWISLVAVILVVGFIELLLGELIPKRLAMHHAERVALRVAGPLEALAVVTAPAVWFLAAVTNATARLFGVTEHAPPPSLTEEEIKSIVEESEKEGVLEEQETEMIHSVLEFTDIVVREVMVPRIDVIAVEVNTTIAELLEVVLRSGHTRIPVFDETVDNIVGIVHAKDLLRSVRDGLQEKDIRSASVMRSVYYVPENMKVDDLLAEFQRTKHQLAIVVDEYGGTAGLVTLEDLLEEIVGPITDEYDVETEPTISVIDENMALVDARVAIDDVNEALGTAIPEEESETVGGFVFSLLGKIPSVGEVVEHDNLRIEVMEADSRRVTRVRITRVPQDAGHEDEREA